MIESKGTIPWNRYGLIIELVKRLNGVADGYVNKAIIYRVIYILQEAYGIDLEYDFKLRISGIFNWELIDELNLLENYNYITSRYSIDTGSDNIKLAERYDNLTQKAKAF